MAMFGAKGDFLDPYGFRTPPIHGGAPDTIPMSPAGDIPKPGFFDEGGLGRPILGGIGDALSTWGGGQPVYAQAQQHKRAEELYGRRQADEQRQWMSRELWKRANPEPVKNDTANDFEYIKSILGEEAAKQYLQGKADPVVNIPLPGGDVYMGPRSGISSIGGGGPTPAKSAPSPTAAEYLRKNPNLAADFDAKYGPGASAQILGGAGSGPRTFP